MPIKKKKNPDLINRTKLRSEIENGSKPRPNLIEKAQ